MDHILIYSIKIEWLSPAYPTWRGCHESFKKKFPASQTYYFRAVPEHHPPKQFKNLKTPLQSTISSHLRVSTKRLISIGMSRSDFLRYTMHNLFFFFFTSFSTKVSVIYRVSPFSLLLNLT